MASQVKILLVDDERRLTESMAVYLKKHDYDVQAANTGLEALTKLSERNFDILLLDLSLPDISGYEVMENLLTLPKRPIVIVLTGVTSQDSVVRCLKLGAYDYLNKPFELEDLDNRIRVAYEYRKLEVEKETIRLQLEMSETRFQYLIRISPDIIFTLDTQNRFSFISESVTSLLGWSSEQLLSKPFTTLLHPDDLCRLHAMRCAENKAVELRLVENGFSEGLKDFLTFEVKTRMLENLEGLYGVARDISARKEDQVVLQQTLKQLRKSMGAVVHAMASTVEVRDPYTAGHQQRVSNLARTIAEKLRLSQDEIDGIRMAGNIHDLGKINVPAEILSKPGTLSDIEFSLIKTHPEIGYEILKEIEFPWPVAELVHQHHERMDGSGYPRQLDGEDIMMGARVIAVADVVEAIASHRPYRPSLGRQIAMEEISKRRGVAYDVDVVDACIEVLSQGDFEL